MVSCAGPLRVVVLLVGGTMADDLIDERVPSKPDPDPKRVKSRAASLRREQPGVEDPEAAAEELLEDSEARTNTDPAPRTLDEKRVERRTSDEATPPAPPDD